MSQATSARPTSDAPPARSGRWLVDLLLSACCVAVVSVIGLRIVPAFERNMIEFEIELPSVTQSLFQWLIQGSNLLARWWYLIAPAAVGMLWLACQLRGGRRVVIGGSLVLLALVGVAIWVPTAMILDALSG